MSDAQVIYGKCRIIGQSKKINVYSSSNSSQDASSSSHVHVDISYGMKIEIDKKFAELKLQRDIFIEDGDYIALGGVVTADGIFQCNCYENYTKNIRGYSSSRDEIFFILFGILFCVISIALLIGVTHGTDSIFAFAPFIFGAIFAGYGFNRKTKMDETHSKLRAFPRPILSV